MMLNKTPSCSKYHTTHHTNRGNPLLFKQFQDIGLSLFVPHFIPCSAVWSFHDSFPETSNCNRVTYHWEIRCNDVQSRQEMVSGLYWFINCQKYNTISYQWKLAPDETIEFNQQFKDAEYLYTMNEIKNARV